MKQFSQRMRSMYGEKTLETFSSQIPEILQEVKEMALPLNSLDSIHLMRFLMREQIEWDDLSNDLKNEFMKTSQYEYYLESLNEKC